MFKKNIKKLSFFFSSLKKKKNIFLKERAIKNFMNYLEENEIERSLKVDK